jgi:hypothetical protein
MRAPSVRRCDALGVGASSLEISIETINMHKDKSAASGASGSRPAIVVGSASIINCTEEAAKMSFLTL